METYYIFHKETGAYIGTRGIAPEAESDEIGVLQTPETLAQITECLVPVLVQGQIIEGATPEQIEAHNRSKVPASVSTMVFWLAVFELLGITEEYVKSHVAQIEDIAMRTRILIMLNKAQEFDRSNPFLNQMSEMLRITQEQLDQIFITASTL